MNYERIMLNGAKKMRSDARFYYDKSKRTAINSFCKTNTLKQICKVLHFREKADYCQTFFDVTYGALQLTAIGYRALLAEIYLKKTDPKVLCGKYGVSLPKLYRILAKARTAFRSCLILSGATEKWFFDNYGQLSWVKEMSRFVPGRGGKLFQIS